MKGVPFCMEGIWFGPWGRVSLYKTPPPNPVGQVAPK